MSALQKMAAAGYFLPAGGGLFRRYNLAGEPWDDKMAMDSAATPLGAALRERYHSPEEAISALGLDAALLNKESKQMATRKASPRSATK